jgi:DNA-binding HxlR family transcriptional regulator
MPYTLHLEDAEPGCESWMGESEGNVVTLSMLKGYLHHHCVLLGIYQRRLDGLCKKELAEKLGMNERILGKDIAEMELRKLVEVIEKPILGKGGERHVVNLTTRGKDLARILLSSIAEYSREVDNVVMRFPALDPYEIFKMNYGRSV